jgi:uncharacterized membrane-anchored protein YitT (DUF2179 family)
MPKNDKPTSESVKHGWMDDITGLGTGIFLAAFGIFMLKSAHLVTGGTAGLALLISYLVPVQFGALYSSISVPFLALAVWKKGWNFALRSALCVGLVSLAEALVSQNVSLAMINPLFASLAGNLIVSVGLLILFRHKSSLGGINVIALLAQEKLGWRAGYVQMAFDIDIV